MFFTKNIGKNIMTYYSNWQEALMDFTRHFGHNYTDSYNLMVEFELLLHRNKNGTYFMEKLR